MIERLELIKKRYEEINVELMKEENLSDIKTLMKLNKEKAELEEVVNKYEEYKKVLNDIKEAEIMTKDPEMSEFAKEELTNLQQKKDELEHEIEIILLPKDPNDGKNVIVEIMKIFAGSKKYCYEEANRRLEKISNQKEIIHLNFP